MEKAAQTTRVSPGSQLVASFSDPLRSCRMCGAEMSFDGGDQDVVFSCPLGEGHDVVRAL